jgi:hypothetical protein
MGIERAVKRKSAAPRALGVREYGVVPAVSGIIHYHRVTASERAINPPPADEAFFPDLLNTLRQSCGKVRPRAHCPYGYDFGDNDPCVRADMPIGPISRSMVESIAWVSRAFYY